MNQFGIFLYESGISIAILYLFYWFLLRKETYFSLNRIILGISMALAITLPFIKITVNAMPESGTMVYIIDQYLMDDLFIAPETTLAGESNTISFLNIIYTIYFAGVFIFSVKFFVQLFQVMGLIKKYGINKFSGYKIVPLKKDISPFSFFNLIFINTRNINNDELKNILHHEWEHIKRLHTVDIIVLEIICILQWFNPFVWLYKYAVREVHEYEADRGVIKNGESKISYQKLILQQVFGNQFFQGVHNLINHSLIKKRITMITKTQSKKRTIIKSLFILPIAAILVATFSFTGEAVPSKDSENPLSKLEQDNSLSFIFPIIDPLDNFSIPEFTLKNDKPDQKPALLDSAEIFFIVEEMPSFQGKGPEGFRTWILQNLKYPEEARGNKIEGKVFVRCVVEKDGSVSNVTVVREAHPLLDAEASRVVKSSPKWIPGKQRGKAVRVSLTFPITFYLDGNVKKITDLIANMSEEALYVLDGKTVTKEEVNKIDPKSILVIRVLRGDDALEKYGEKGKNGVIIFTTKNDMSPEPKPSFFEEINPIFIIDGKIISKKEWEELNTNNIQKIEVIKGEKAVEKFGEKAGNGAVIITTKDK